MCERSTTTFCRSRFRSQKRTISTEMSCCPPKSEFFRRGQQYILCMAMFRWRSVRRFVERLRSFARREILLTYQLVVAGTRARSVSWKNTDSQLSRTPSLLTVTGANSVLSINSLCPRPKNVALNPIPNDDILPMILRSNCWVAFRRNGATEMISTREVPLHGRHAEAKTHHPMMSSTVVWR